MNEFEVKIFPYMHSRETVVNSIWSELLVPYFKANPLAIKAVFLDGMAAVGKGTFARHLEDLGFMALAAGEYMRTASWWYSRFKVESLSEDEFFDSLHELSVSFTYQGQNKVVVASHPSLDTSIELYPSQASGPNGLRSAKVEETFWLSKHKRTNEWYNAQVMKFIDQSDKPVVIDGRNNYEKPWAHLENTALIYFFAQRGAISKRAITRLKAQYPKDGIKSPSTSELIRTIRSTHTRNDIDMSKDAERLLRPEEAQISGKYDLVLDVSNMSAKEVATYVMLTVFSKILSENNLEWVYFAAASQHIFQQKDSTAIQDTDLIPPKDEILKPTSPEDLLN